MQSNIPKLVFSSHFFSACLFVLTLLFSLTASSSSDDAWIQAAENSIASISQQIDEFDSKRDDRSLLVALEKQITIYNIKAQKCVDEASPPTTRLQSLIPDGADQTTTGIFGGLTAKTESRLRFCQAILLDTQNLSKQIQILESNILTEYLLSRDNTLLATVQKNIDSLDSTVTSLLKFVDDRIQLTSFDKFEWSSFLIAILIAWFIGSQLGKKLVQRAGQRAGNTITEGLLTASYACLGRSLPLLMASLAAISVIAAFLPLTPVPTSIAVFTSLTVYLLTIISARILLNPCEPAKHYLLLNADFSTSLYRRLQFLLVLGLVAVLTFSTNLKEIVTQPQWELLRTSFITLTIVNLVWLISQLNRTPGLLGNTLLRSLVIITLIFALIAEYSGYRNLAGYLFKGIIGSIFLGIALWFIYALLHDVLDSLDEGRHQWQQHLRKKLQLKKKEPIPGMLWIRLFSILVLWMFFAISMLQLWRYSDSGWLWFLEHIKDGFSIGGFKIMPLQILLGIGLFAVLLTFVRWFRQDTLPKWVNQTKLDHGGREALITISGYIGVLLSAVFGLSVAGFDFTNLAIIAGALSVGIGFGLQNIVNNFVSGLILLFERPIRTGDWVVVGNTEGYVRKISIRSTQIETFDRADVIVPNSELISNQVTNWMLNDSWGRVISSVGVAYGSDVRKVEQLLIACGMEHPLVVKDSKRVNPPRVIFRGFGDSSLDFELRCFISNVDKRLSTLSDLNFAIEKSLRENGIQIPFPQRDLHLRSVDSSVSFSKIGTNDNNTAK